MDDFETLAQIALDPAVTLTVIACLTLVIILQYLDGRRRLRNQARRLGKVTRALLASVIAHMQRETIRKVAAAAELTFDIMRAGKRTGEDDTTLEEILFGGTPFKPGRPYRDGDDLPDLKELRAAAKGPAPYSKAAVTVDHAGETIKVREFDTPPYRAVDVEDRSPRAG